MEEHAAPSKLIERKIATPARFYYRELNERLFDAPPQPSLVL
jgi:hypothetical protein